MKHVNRRKALKKRRRGEGGMKKTRRRALRTGEGRKERQKENE
jgi:hypothetical protein